MLRNIIVLTIVSIFLASQGFAQQSNNKSVIKADIQDQVCVKDSDCTIVPADCSGCACGIPVNINTRQKYLDQLKGQCKPSAGCDASCKIRGVACINKKCALK